MIARQPIVLAVLAVWLLSAALATIALNLTDAAGATSGFWADWHSLYYLLMAVGIVPALINLVMARRAMLLSGHLGRGILFATLAPVV